MRSEENVLMEILKYSFLLRYVSNNQVIALGSFLEAEIPMNLHICTQALSAGLKPRSEKYFQERLEFREKYKLMFGQEINSSEIDQSSPNIQKLYLSGYTRNILINDPFFCQMLLLFIGVFLVLVPLSMTRVLRSGQSQYSFQNSLLFKLLIFLFNQIAKMIEASLLTILITNFIFSESPNARRKYDVLNLFYILFIDLTFAGFLGLQVKMINQRFYRRREVLLVEQVFDEQLHDLGYQRIIEEEKSPSWASSARKNYHILGMAKKVALVLIVFSVRQSLEVKFYLIYAVLGAQLLAGLLLRPFCNRYLNFFRSLSDLLIAGLFVVLQVSNSMLEELG